MLDKRGVPSMHNLILKIFLSKKGEGIITGMIWLSVAAIVSGTIAYSIWAAMGSSAGSVKTLITNTIH